MKNILLFFIVCLFLGCSANKTIKTEIILLNIGTINLPELWISYEGKKYEIGNIAPGNNVSVTLENIGSKQIDYGFKGDNEIRIKD